MPDFFGFPKDVWAKLVLLNNEESKLDWNLQKRNGTFKLSVFWKPKVAVKEFDGQASCRTNQASPHGQASSPRKRQEKSLNTATQTKKEKLPSLNKTDLPKKKVKKHKPPSVLRRDQARLESWKTRWNPAASPSQTVKHQEQEHKQASEETSVDHQHEPGVICDAGKPRAADDRQRELILASIQRLQELSNSNSLSADLAPASSGIQQVHSLESVLRVSCFHCNKPDAEVAGGLKLCTRCRGASYCSRECQTKDWRVHKPICSPAKTDMIEKITSSLQQELNVLSNAK